MSLLDKVNRVRDLVNALYNWYVPPFQINRILLSEDELRTVINDLYNKAPFQSWFRLDGNYYTTDLATFKKIISWDWTDTRKYVSDTFDCDKFAMYFKSRISIDYGINSVGIILDYSAVHAYNLVILKDDTLRWLLYEPQNDSIFTFENRNTIYYAMKDYVLIL